MNSFNFAVCLCFVIAFCEKTNAVSDHAEEPHRMMKREMTADEYQRQLERQLRPSLVTTPNPADVPCEDDWSLRICGRYQKFICHRYPMQLNCLKSCNLCHKFVQYRLEKKKCKDNWPRLCPKWKKNLCHISTGEEKCKKTCGFCEDED